MKAEHKNVKVENRKIVKKINDLENENDNYSQFIAYWMFFSISINTKPSPTFEQSIPIIAMDTTPYLSMCELWRS